MEEFKRENYPLVSIITPSYNQANFLEETILSVLNQEYNNIEYIIIDGGSKDGSLEIIRKYEKYFVYWASETDKGQGDAINKGIAKSKGEYICWVNSDDLLYPGFIESRVTLFQKNPDVDLIYGDVDQGKDPDKSWLRRGKQTSFNNILKTLDVPIPQQSAMWRRKVIDHTGLLDPNLYVLLDRDYFIRISKNHRILYDSGALSFFRIHEKSKSISETIKWAEELPPYYSSLTKSWVEYKKHSKRVMSQCFWLCGNIYAENNELILSKEFFNKAKKSDLLTYTKLSLIRNMVKIKQTLNKLIKF
jgi:glycosyltransferase involved in cell wall biosynthesis